MFSPKTALGVGLASAALLTGCGTETVGNSIMAPNGECIQGVSNLKLTPDQEVYVGADIKLSSGLGAENPADYLRLKNAGKGILSVTRSKGDEGTLNFPTSAAIVDPNQGGDEDASPTDLSFDLNQGKTAEFSYREDAANLDIDTAILGSAIEVEISTTCSK